MAAGMGSPSGSATRRAGGGRWTHQVIVLHPGGNNPPGRSALGANPLAPYLHSLLDDGRAEQVFSAPGRGTAAARRRLPAVLAVKTFGDDETRETLERLQDEDESAVVYVAPPRFALGRSSGKVNASPQSVAGMNHWGMQAIDIGTCQVDASQITVAVVDTGVDRTHPDLAAAIADYVNCCSSEPDDDVDGHGTHVCGIIAGAGAPPSGMQGASNARLAVYKGLSLHYDATAYYRALGLACLRAPIVNLSLGGPDHDPTEELLIQQAQQAGVLIVAASGNDYDDGTVPNYPAALDDVVAVGAVDDKFVRAAFSNSGPHLALMAPGVDIWSTVPTKPSNLFLKQTMYAQLSGTSMAAPFVTGVAARVAAMLGTPTAQQIRERLPVKRCPGQSTRTEELGAGFVHWGGPLELGLP